MESALPAGGAATIDGCDALPRPSGSRMAVHTAAAIINRAVVPIAIVLCVSVSDTWPRSLGE